jgi:hypothetical protein
MSEVQIITKPNTAVVRVSNFKVTLPVEVVETLPLAVQKVAAAKNSPCIVDFDIKELSTKITTLIASTFQDAGQIIEPGDLATMSYRLQRELFDYPWLHFAELELAVSNGSKKLYGKYFGINVLSILEWIGAYRLSEECKRYAHELSKVVYERPDPSEEEKDRIGRELAFKTFEDFNAGKDISLPSVTVYDYLDRKGAIIYSKEQKKEFMTKATESVKINLAQQASKTDNKAEVMKLKLRITDIAKLQTGETDLTDEETAKALQINEAKRLALKSFFADLVEFEQELLID